MTISTEELIRSLFVYLGGDDDAGGIEPIGGEHRLQLAFPADYAARIEAVQRIVDEVASDTESYKEPDLQAVGHAATERTQRLHPEFSPVLCRKLGNWYSFQWR